MPISLPRPDADRAAFHRFAQEHVAGFAAVADREQRIDPGVVSALAGQGWLAPFLPPNWGGQGMDFVRLGELHEEIGRACSSVRSLLTVHSMCAASLLRFGTESLRDAWLPALARGDRLGALALSEPNAGSDLNDIETTARSDGAGYVLDGTKKWMTCGQIANLFVVLAKCDGQAIALAVESDRPGLRITPLNHVVGTRGSMIAQLDFDGCFVPREQLLGRPGFGNFVALHALGLGRYSVACGAVGIAQACLDASLAYTDRTRRSGVALREQQLVQRMISDMVTDIVAARLLCREAGRLKDEQDPREIQQSFVAKYHASTAAVRAALDAVQLHGANGLSAEYPVERHLRDAKVTEIIEGSTQIQQTTIASFAFQEFARARADARPVAPA